MTTLEEIGEVGILDEVYKHFGLTDELSSVIGIGDDAAVIHRENDASLLVTVDSLIEGTHFLFDKISPVDLGRKALSVNLSDIAAMGGVPRFAFIALGARKETPMKWVQGLLSGLKECASMYGVLILGGDTVKSQNGEMISITLIGECRRENIKLRSDAKPGDIVAITGELGGSAFGLELLLQGIESDFIRQHVSPRPHVEEGIWLGERSVVHAMMDISDGISLDLERMARASNISIEVRTDLIPISKEFFTLGPGVGLDPMRLAVSGGEDYVLAVTVERASFDKLSSSFQDKFGSELYKIGEVKEGDPHLKILDNSGMEVKISTGFDNFRS